MTPATNFQINGRPAQVVAWVRTRQNLVLIAKVGTDTFHLIDQHADGSLHDRLGPVTTADALRAAERVLAGREGSATADSLTAVTGAVALAVQGGAFPRIPQTIDMEG